MLLPIGRAVGLHTLHHTYHAVIIAVSQAVVFYKHHLSTHFQFQMPLGRGSTVGEIALHDSIENLDRRIQGFQIATVDFVGLPVVGSEQDRLLSIGKNCRVSRFPHTGVEGCQRSFVEFAVADIVEQTQKERILLTVYCRQLNGYIQQPLQGLAVEKEWRRIHAFNIGAFLVGNYRSQLLHISNHQQLHSPEGAPAAPITPHYRVHGIQQVCPHHTYLVYYQQIECTYDVYLRLPQLPLVLRQLILRHELLHVG